MRLKEGISPPPGHGTHDTGQPHLGADTALATTPAIWRLAVREERGKEKMISIIASISIFFFIHLHHDQIT